jgi:ABC-type transporter Mla subunit MlaD
MSDPIFRVVITAAVALACIAFMVQAAVAIAFYRAVRKIQETVDDLSDSVQPLLAKVHPVIDKMTPVIEKAGPVVDRLGPMSDGATQTLERLKPVIEKTVAVIGKVGTVADHAVPVVDGARQVVAHANEIVVEVRPQITHFSEEAVATVHSCRDQVERVGSLLHDATDRARARLEQIDESVENTVGQVSNVGGAMKRAVLRPVREANGLAAGISAAVSSLVAKKASPGVATQDEEMFI